jgi:hypothetical protein
MNSTVIILKICGLTRKRLVKGPMVAGWQISGKTMPAPSDNRGLHLKRDEPMALVVSQEGLKDPGESKSISFYKTGDEASSVIFPTMKGRFFPSLKNAQVVRPSGMEF